MLTLNEDKENVLIGHILPNIDVRRGVPVYWHPRKNEKLRMDVELNDYLESKKFRIKYRLTSSQQEQIIDHLINDSVPENVGLRNIFYQIRSDVENSLYTELNLVGTEETFRPLWYEYDKRSWAGHMMVAGNSGAGKSYTMMSQYIKWNLDGPAKQRRRFLYVSAEAHTDKSLAPLRKKKYSDNIQFVDLSTDSVEKHGVHDVKGNSETYWKEVVYPKISTMPTGSVIILDDYQDAHGTLSQKLRVWSNTAMRTYRHKGVGVVLLMHSIRNSSFSSQSHNSVKAFLLFPRTQKSKITDWLVKDLGLSTKESRGLVDFAESGRWMYCRIHSPQFMANDKLVRLF